MPEPTGIAGLPADGSTMVSGLPTAPAEESMPPDWPLALLMTAVAVIVAYALVAAQWGDVGTRRAQSTFGLPALPAGKAAQGSYVEPANFREAIDQIGRRTGPGARVQLMRVDRDQVWTVLDVKGRQRVIRVSGGSVTDDDGGQASSAETRLDAIDTEAPQRMLRGLQEKFRVTPEQLDYFAMAGWNGEWNAFLKDGSFYHANPSGRKLVKAG